MSRLDDAAGQFVGLLRLNDGFDQLELDELCGRIARLGRQRRTSHALDPAGEPGT